MRRSDYAIEVVKRAEQRVDLGVLRDIVSEVRHWRDEDRRDPDRINPQLGDIGKPLNDAAQISHAVPVAVLKRARIDLVDDAGLPPRRLHGQAFSLTMAHSSTRSNDASDRRVPSFRSGE